jgi:hypothetical protein
MKVKRDKSGKYRLADDSGRLAKREGKPVDDGGFRSALDAKLTIEELRRK